MKNVQQKECKVHGLTDFAESTEKGKIRYRCKKCRVDAVVKRRLKVKQDAINYKGGCCSKCGYDKCRSALEFHHLDPSQKDFGVGEKGYTKAWETIKMELDKCILVCANCHREIHAKSK